MTSVKATDIKKFQCICHSFTNREEEIWRRRTHPLSFATIPLLKIHHSTIITFAQRERERDSCYKD
jgi:hypothetical protein